jgi:uncharacterized membrane protein YqjE
MSLPQSFLRVAEGLARSLDTRIRLFAAELELERLRLIRVICLCIVGAVTLSTAMLTATALVVVMVDDPYRPVILLGMSGFLALVGGGCFYFAFSAGNRHGPFEASTDMLKEDCECLASIGKD